MVMLVTRTDVNQSNVTLLVGVNVSADSPTPDEQHVAIIIIKGIIMFTIITGAILGNVLVITSVFRFERLRAITNYFIVSLACADLLVAMLAMPFNASLELTGGRWIFGRVMCDIFNANDVLFSTSSILHLCCISMDRYIAIMHPFQYETSMTTIRVAIMLAITWIASIMISYIPIQSQLYTTNDNYERLEENPDACLFVVNKTYAAVSSCVSFWIPCTIMVIVYTKIFLEARKQEKQISATLNTQYAGVHMANGSSGDDRDKIERRKMKREHKAAKTLGVIMGAFIICFLPFFSWYLITSMCEQCTYPDVVGSILFWTGYFNSFLNPLLYASFNRDFRNAFKKVLKLETRCRYFRSADPSAFALNKTYNSDQGDSGSKVFNPNEIKGPA